MTTKQRTRDDKTCLVKESKKGHAMRLRKRVNQESRETNKQRKKEGKKKRKNNNKRSERGSQCKS